MASSSTDPLSSSLIDKNIFINTDIILTGSLIGLIFAYVIKSYALANSTFESGFQRISFHLDDSARTLNSSGWNLLSRVHFPLLKTSFLTSILLVTSEVVKELPATLILRPFNFDTLATQLIFMQLKKECLMLQPHQLQ